MVRDSEGDLSLNFLITVSMAIVNNPPQFASAVNTFSVNEGEADGTIVGTISVSDESESNAICLNHLQDSIDWLI